MMRSRSLPRTIALLAGVMLGTACATGTRAGAGSDLPARPAGTPSLDARLLAMADHRRADTTLLDTILANTERTDEARRYRAQAALLIGQVQERTRYATLRRLLVDADTGVAASSAFALGLARDTASLEALARALAGAPDVVAAEAAWALGRIGEPARAVITAALEGGAASPARGAPVRAALLFAASGLRPVPVEVIVPFFRDPEADVVFAAGYAIARPRAAGGVRALFSLARHRDPMVRVQAALGGALNASGDSLAAPAVTMLRLLLGDTDARVRVQAIRSLASHAAVAVASSDTASPGESAATSALVAAILAGIRDSVAAVRVTTAEAAGPLVRRDAMSWRALFAADTTFMVRRALLDGAVRHGMLLDELAAWRTHPDPWARVASLELSANVPEAPSPLTRSLWARSDRSERVRAAALSFGTTSELPAVRDTLRAWLGDPSPLVRAAALGGLAARATAADLPLAIARYTTDTAPNAHAVRAAALRVIAAAWRRDSAAIDDSLRQRFAALAPPSDPLPRRSVLEVTPLAHWRRLDSLAADPTAYERVVTQWLVPARVGRLPRALLRTVRGDITLELLVTDAPLTVDNFVRLARADWFDGTRFHRVIPNFVAQDGDPTGTGSGGPGTSIRDELNRHRYVRGAVGMALSGPDTGGSQYFLTLTPQPHLDGGYTVFARVIDGFAAMDALLQGDRILDVVVP